MFLPTDGVPLYVCIFSILLPGALSITCLSCHWPDGLEHMSDCNHAIECLPAQTCYIDKFLSPITNTPRFTVGCRDVKQCNLLECKKEQLGQTTPLPPVHGNNRVVTCSECCYNDTCNTRGCGETFAGPVSGGHELVQCFQCAVQRKDRAPCTAIGSCQVHERCVTEYSINNEQGEPNYKLGCMHQDRCNFFQMIAAINNEPLTRSCCNEHLCNQSPFKRFNISQTMPQRLACPTDLVPTTTTHKPTTMTTPITTAVARQPVSARAPCLSCVNTPTNLTGCRVVHCNAKELCFVAVSAGTVNAGCRAKVSCHAAVVVGKKRDVAIGQSRSRGHERDIAIGQLQSRDATICSTCCDPANQCLCNVRVDSCKFSNFHVIPFIVNNCV